MEDVVINGELLKQFIEAVVELSNRFALLQQIALDARRAVDENDRRMQDSIRESLGCNQTQDRE